MVQPLTGAIRTYPWGSRTAIAQMAGRPTPSDHPEAEMWFGAHPGAPATVDGEPLDVLIASDSVSALGAGMSRAYEGRLPFLIKLLAADKPLSLQAHPTKEQAEEGCAREDTLGIARDALERNYRDDNHKPELIVALTQFDAMCGFRPVEQTLKLFDALSVPELERYRVLISGILPSEGLRSLVTTWITLPSDQRKTLIAAVVEGARAYRDSGKTEFAMVADHLIELADRYPSDPGVLCALLLNHIRLEPGEGIYLNAGQLHAYVHGFGVEIMANSDNVLRGGLTSKHIDVPELVRVLSFDPLPDPVITPNQLTTGGSASGESAGSQFSEQGVYYPTPAPEFRLQRWELNSGQSVAVSSVASDGKSLSEALVGPAIVLCTRGTVHVSQPSADDAPASEGDDHIRGDGFGPLDLTPSQAAWIPDDAESTLMTNTSDELAEVFVATVAG